MSGEEKALRPVPLNLGLETRPAGLIRGRRVSVPNDYTGVAASVVEFDRLPRSGDDERDLDRFCRAAWTRIAEPDSAWAAALIAEFGPVAALAVAAVGDGAEARAQFAPRLAELSVPRDLEIAGKVDARVIVPADPDWPRGVDDLIVPPRALWVKGAVGLSAACEASVAVVGARASSSYGDRIAADLGFSLAERGYGVVSGAAYGIDAAAHAGALAVEGVTVAVLACGVDQPYPAAHASLLESIAERGAVLSETAPGNAAFASRFLQRNRLIATMTQGTVVVEAGMRSGARNTAGTAAEYHRVVMALPGPITSVSSAGCHELVRSGMAMLITGADDIVEALAPIGSGLAEGIDAGRLDVDLPPNDAKVLAVMSSRGRSIAKIAAIAGVSSREVAAALGRLDMAGLVQQSPGGWRTVAGSRLRR